MALTSILKTGVAGAALLAAMDLPGLSHAQETNDPGEAPPTTLPFEPTVPSAPPTRPTYPQPQSPPPPPTDPVCLEIGPIIRAGVTASRFATLSPATAAGGTIGRYDAGEAFNSIGISYCTVVIPAAAALTADSPYNQVTCQIAIEHGETAYVEDLRESRAPLAEQIAACPAMARWTSAPPEPAGAASSGLVEDHIFSHPDVAVEIALQIRHHEKAGDWPASHLRALSLVFRTPNPDRPPPDEPEETAAEPAE
ncbi:MAG: hypothetical protein WA989_10695 [Henriciella sp.]|uniref:hypothetical protein n=1 Tax=Henriciella sp. TaxID=1968823 RepID=UPI003C742BCB